MNDIYNITTKGDPSSLYPSGIAQVVIPVDVERDVYIAECYKTATVSIYSEHNGFMNRVPVDKFTLNFIEFPKEREGFGSNVSYKVDPIQKRAIIDGIYFSSNDLCDLKENQFKFKRSLNGNVVEIVGSPDGKYLGLNVSANKGGEVFINVKSEDESGKVTINVDGDLNLTALSETTIKQYGKLSLVTVNKDDADEVTVEEHTSEGRVVYSKKDRLNTENYLINNGNENFVLGQAFKKFMEKFIDEVASSTVTTSIGLQPLVNKEKIIAFKDNIDEFLSQVGFIDK